MLVLVIVCFIVFVIVFVILFSIILVIFYLIFYYLHFYYFIHYSDAPEQQFYYFAYIVFFLPKKYFINDIPIYLTNVT
jgi:hypothetical protein